MEQIKNKWLSRRGEMTVLRKVERFLRISNMPETKFGRLAVNDPRLVRDMRNGRETGGRVNARIEAFIAMAARR